MDKRAKFLKTYAKLPEVLRNQIIAMIDGKPYNWDAIYFEIKNNTTLSKKILNTLSDMDII